MTNLIDVLVVGGGPTGAVTALALARSGLQVVVLENSRYAIPRLGETVSPAANHLLRQMGVWDSFVLDSHVASPGTVVVWGNQTPFENDFIFNPYGLGWHLDRARFDRMLADAAEKAGATIILAAKVTASARINDDAWIVRYTCDGSPRTICAKFLVDATGRSAWLARTEGAKRLVLDRLVGVVGFGETELNQDPRTILEATKDGWWYAARLPSGKVVSAFMTDVDLLPHGSGLLKTFWRERLDNAPLTKALWSNPNEFGRLQVKFAGTVRLDRIGGSGWIAAGDAAFAMDPLSSQGIVKAMESGLRLGEMLPDFLRGNRRALCGYSNWLVGEFVDYVKNYFSYYKQVQRWPDSPFWRRRTTASAPLMPAWSESDLFSS